MQRYAALDSPLPPFLRAIASEFFVGSKEEATADLRQRVEVIAIEQTALSTHSKPEANRDLHAKSTNYIAIPLREYISPVKVLPPREPLPSYDDAQKANDYVL